MGAAIDRALGELAALRAERQRRLDYLQALIDTVAAAVLVTTEDGRIEFANRAAAQRLGEAPTLTALPALGPTAGAQLAAKA